MTLHFYHFIVDWIDALNASFVMLISCWCPYMAGKVDCLVIYQFLRIESKWEYSTLFFWHRDGIRVTRYGDIGHKVAIPIPIPACIVHLLSSALDIIFYSYCRIERSVRCLHDQRQSKEPLDILAPWLVGRWVSRRDKPWIWVWDGALSKSFHSCFIANFDDGSDWIDIRIEYCYGVKLRRICCRRTQSVLWTHLLLDSSMIHGRLEI